MYILSQVLGVAGIISMLASIAFDTRKKLPVFENEILSECFNAF